MGEPTAAEPLDHTVSKKPIGSREFCHNNKDNIVSLKVVSDAGQIKFNEIDLTYGSSNSQIYSIKENDILSPKITYEAEFGFSRDTWNVQTKSKLVVTCNEENFFSKVVYLDLKTMPKYLLAAGILQFQELFFD